VTTAATGAGGPTVLRILLGSQLRRLREAQGISRDDAGYAIRASGSKISRMELGRVGFKLRDVDDLLTLYGVNDQVTRSKLVALARQANAPGWWHKYGDVLPDWFQVYVGLEEAATLIRTYEVQFVPGLLQTEEYVRAIASRNAGSAMDEEVERRVTLRMTRQQLLVRSDAPRLWAVIDESALRRPIGGRDVMRGQIERLIEATKMPNVTLQLLPFGVGGHSAEAGAYTVLRFPEPDLPDVVYLEQLTSALYLDKPDDVEKYLEAMERLCIESDTPEQTVESLSRILQET
jgi:transcriptional regulator with XRE-family HTH domain